MEYTKENILSYIIEYNNHIVEKSDSDFSHYNNMSKEVQKAYYNHVLPYEVLINGKRKIVWRPLFRVKLKDNNIYNLRLDTKDLPNLFSNHVDLKAECGTIINSTYIMSVNKYFRD